DADSGKATIALMGVSVAGCTGNALFNIWAPASIGWVGANQATNSANAATTQSQAQNARDLAMQLFQVQADGTLAQVHQQAQSATAAIQQALTANAAFTAASQQTAQSSVNDIAILDQSHILDATQNDTATNATSSIISHAIRNAATASAQQAAQ